MLYTNDYIANTNKDEYFQALCNNNFSEKIVNTIKKEDISLNRLLVDNLLD